MQLTDKQLRNFFQKVQITPNGCWLWIGVKSSGGYGQVKIQGKMRQAHRIIFEHFKGELPIGYEIDHLCRVRNCVNYETHLEPVTHKTNMERAGAGFIIKEFCVRGHPYDEINTFHRRLPNGKTVRRCKACYAIHLQIKKQKRLGLKHHDSQKD